MAGNVTYAIEIVDKQKAAAATHNIKNGYEDMIGSLGVKSVEEISKSIEKYLATAINGDQDSGMIFHRSTNESQTEFEEVPVPED